MKLKDLVWTARCTWSASTSRPPWGTKGVPSERLFTATLLAVLASAMLPVIPPQE